MKILSGPLLKDRTTLRLGGQALAEVFLESPADFESLNDKLESLGGRPFVLGMGSNILAMDGILDIVLVRLPNKNSLYGHEALLEDHQDEVLVRVGAGCKLNKLLGFLRRHNLGGLAELSGVPGTVGGAVAGNAGSWGVSIGDYLRRVRVYKPDSGFQWLDKENWHVGYRHFALLNFSDAPPKDCNLPERKAEDFWILSEVELGLKRGAPAEITRIGREKARLKALAQPIREATAGCVFKNPSAQSAGHLLEAVGFKGRRLGDMEFSSLHANFLVNKGSGSSKEAFELIELAREAVKKRFAIDLQMEVKVMQ